MATNFVVEDRTLLAQWFELYRPQLLRMIELRIDPSLRARVDADDILQSAFLRAHSKWPMVAEQFREQNSNEPLSESESPRMTPYAWLYRVVLDTLIDAWRKHSRQCRDLRIDIPLPEGSSMELGLGLVAIGTSPSGYFSREELCARVRRLIAMLKPEYREILWMRHHDQLSYAEIASVLEITEINAGVRHARALQNFEKIWESLK